MFLEKLSEYADQIDLPAPMYQLTPIRYVIHLDANGNFQGIDEFIDGKNKVILSRDAPHCKRSSGIKPKLLVDNGEYTLGIAREKSDPRRVDEQHIAYVTQVRECAVATREPTVVAVAHFLGLPDNADIIKRKKPEFDPSSNVTFRINGDYPFEQEAVQEYWAKKAAAASEDGPVMQCLVCGEMRPPVERLPIVIKGIPGGQSTGLTLISANAAAFESYGLVASLIAPTCEVCGERFGNALNELLRKKSTRIILPPLAYIFWVRHAKEAVVVEDDLDIPDLMDEPKPEVVKELYKAAFRGDASSTLFDAPAFYAATLSASGARVVLRDWIETSVEAAQKNLARYFWLQRIQDNEGNPGYFPLQILIRATINQKSKEKPLAQVGEALMHVALHGGQLPSSIIHNVVRRIRANRKVQPEQAALIKMVLLSRRGTLNIDYERDFTMTTVNEEDTSPAYLCGRLLAQLDYIQFRALGKVNATIVDRFYGTASTAPAVVFPRLLKGAIPHLSAIRSERNKAAKSYAGSLSYPDKELAKLLEHLTSFPSILRLEQQGMFALGFFHQRAHILSQTQKISDDVAQSGNAEDASIQIETALKEEE
ncbi:MAG TPA: type I-C CRISPR-associated protein Cas8c/Csd1 [Ktedonobacteraceae bacterium]|nr:type I-C CRISPR-associated protein Cas8c/Csd1 [Ktedonobacteraceae bacterium]